MEFRSLERGEVNRAEDVHWCASGKVINVGIASQSLGAPTTILTALGGHTGAAIKDEVQSLSANIDAIELSTPTRVCTTILEADGTTTELVENAGPVDEQILHEFVEHFRIHAEVADITVLTGSMPANAPEEFCGFLIRNIPKRMILDIRGTALLNCLPWNPFIIKPNREELAQTIDGAAESDEATLAAMLELNLRGAEWVVVSDGPRAVYVSSREEQFKLTPPAVEVVNPIGCGDCLAVGMAYSLTEIDEHDVVTATRLGMGAAAENAQQLLPARISLEQAQQLADLVSVEDMGA